MTKTRRLKLAPLNPDVQASIDGVMAELTDLWDNDKVRGLVVYAMLEDDETRAWSTRGLSTREVIGALFQLAFDNHIAMVDEA